jgi:hypothetical protein
VLAAALAMALAFAAVVSHPPSSRNVLAAPTQVILSAADIPDIGWGLRASGTNGSGVWRLFAVHNELVLAFLNVTLWVESDVDHAGAAASALVRSTGHVPEAGAVAGADASWFWYAGSTPYAGMIVQRYNVVFLESAYLESSWALTKSDLGMWAGWQLSKIEASAA